MRTVKKYLLGLYLTISAIALADWPKVPNWVLKHVDIKTEDYADLKSALIHEFSNVKAITQLTAAHVGYKLKNSEQYAYYTDKTREFLKNLGYKNAATLPIIATHSHNYKSLEKNRFARAPKSFANITGIVLRFGRNESEDAKLFTCAHEAAHIACGHCNIMTRLINKQDSFACEKEADITAARMLCNNGYRWVVEKEVENLFYTVKSGYEHNDGIHPSFKETYEYLSAVLQEPVKERKPFILNNQTIHLICAGLTLGITYHWYLKH